MSAASDKADRVHALAASHAFWLFSLLADTTDIPPDELAKHRRFYETAFVHGYKHGAEDRGSVPVEELDQSEVPHYRNGAQVDCPNCGEKDIPYLPSLDLWECSNCDTRTVMRPFRGREGA